jgi:hypothetical protein
MSSHKYVLVAREELHSLQLDHASYAATFGAFENASTWTTAQNAFAEVRTLDTLGVVPQDRLRVMSYERAAELVYEAEHALRDDYDFDERPALLHPDELTIIDFDDGTEQDQSLTP